MFNITMETNAPVTTGEMAEDDAVPSYVVEPILVVDDSSVHRQIALRLLEKLGFNCIVARNGKEALDVLRKQPVSLVLMDCQMPVLDGLETTKIIRIHEKNTSGRTAIIGCSTNLSESNCRFAGMDDFIQKPLTLRAIEEKLIPWCNTKLACA